MSIEAVIFDLDGIIVESEQVWDRVRHRFVETNGGTWREDSSRHMMGLSTREWVHFLTAGLGVNLPEEQVAERVIDEMKSDYARGLPLMPGAVHAVRELSTSWRLAVASSSPMSLIETVLDGGSMRNAFEVLVSSDEVAAGKPAPDVYLEAARRLRVRIDTCVVVEDSANGIESAATAGAKVIAIPSSAFPPDVETLSLATVTLANIRALTVGLVRGLE